MPVGSRVNICQFTVIYQKTAAFQAFLLCATNTIAARMFSLREPKEAKEPKITFIFGHTFHAWRLSSCKTRLILSKSIVHNTVMSDNNLFFYFCIFSGEWRVPNNRFQSHRPRFFASSRNCRPRMRLSSTVRGKRVSIRTSSTVMNASSAVRSS